MRIFDSAGCNLGDSDCWRRAWENTAEDMPTLPRTTMLAIVLVMLLYIVVALAK